MISNKNMRRVMLMALLQCSALAVSGCGEKDEKKTVEGNTPLLSASNIKDSEKENKSEQHQKLLKEIFGEEGVTVKTHKEGENTEGYIQQDAVAHLDSGEMFNKVTLDDKPIVEKTRNTPPKDGIVYTNWKVEEINVNGVKVASAFVYSQDRLPVVNSDEYNRYNIILRVDKNKDSGLVTHMTLFNPDGFNGEYDKRFPIKVKVDNEKGRVYKVMLDKSGMIAEFHDFMIKDMFQTYNLDFVHMLNLRKKMYVQYMDKHGIEQQVEFNIESIPF